ncbi:MAG: Holliday junction branch migration protein RuvA [Muribaculaceae bacterium]|nr:Holliday junction branch migration protein RuvA [Muribaculaceae bacterium]
MIEYIKGPIASLTPTDVVIETTSGVAYIMSISLSTFTPLQGQTEAKIFVHEVIREDAHQLFGFIDTRERDLFRLLIGVSGVGANTARMILSSIPPAELEVVITSGDSKRLKAVKGIGAKTAERVIIDLKDKVKPVGDGVAPTLMPSVDNNDVLDQAVAALVMLGFPKPASQKAVTKILQGSPDIKVEQAIKLALSML